MIDKWEYDYTNHTEEMKSPYYADFKKVEIIKHAMNERGLQGWELIAVIPGIFEGTCTNFKCFWKRRVEISPEAAK